MEADGREERLRRLAARPAPPAKGGRRRHPAAVARAVTAGISATTGFGLLAVFGLTRPGAGVAIPATAARAVPDPVTSTTTGAPRSRASATPVTRSPAATASPAPGRSPTAPPTASGVRVRTAAPRPAPVTATRGS